MGKVIKEFIGLVQEIFEDVMVYGNIFIPIRNLLVSLTDFIEVVCNMGFEYVIFNGEEDSEKLIRWMIGVIERINQYHSMQIKLNLIIKLFN